MVTRSASSPWTSRFAAGLLRLCLGAVCLLPQDVLACTTAIVSAEASRSGRPMIWKQRDANDAFNVMRHVRGGRFAFTALFATSDSLCKRAYAGINEAGFAIANNLSYNLMQADDNPGKRNGEFMAAALAWCGSLGDFEAFVDGWDRPRGISSNFAVIDAFGGAAYFEVSDTACVRFDVPPGGYLYRTNFSLSGAEGRGRGYARYATIGDMMSRRSGQGFDAGFLLDAGRTFENVLTGENALKGRRRGLISENEFITRDESVSATVIEGVPPGGRPDSGLLWCAIGYPPCCYAVPVWVAARELLPTQVSGEGPANLLSLELKATLHPFSWTGGEKYLNIKPLFRYLRLVRKAEAVELRLGSELDGRFARSGFDEVALRAYYQDMDDRFAAFGRKARE